MIVSRVVFYLFALVSALLVVSILNSLASKRRKDAFSTLRMLLICLGVYGTVLLATALAMPVQVLTANEAQYAGDWSIEVASLRRFPHELDENYEIDFLLANHGTNPIHGENVVAYLLTEDGKRYDAAPEPSSPAFDVSIDPGKSVITTRKYVLPTNLNRVELVVARKGFNLGWFLIGRTPLDGRTAVTLQ